MSEFDVVIIGAGTTGAAAAYHLAEAGMRNMLCLEAGSVGRGILTRMQVVDAAPRDHVDDDSSYLSHISGSAVFEGGDSGPSTIKMVVTVPPYKNLEEFAEHHGWDGVKAYLESAARGRDLIVNLGKKLLPQPQEQVKQLGSMMVCEEKDVLELKAEFEHLRRLGCECSWLSKEEVEAVHGSAAEFAAGISFPHDSILNSPSYAQALLRSAIALGALTLREGCPVADIQTLQSGSVEVKLACGETIIAKKAILATGGFYIDKHLAGILRPCYSYLVALPYTPVRDTPNFFTYGFSHDWCVSTTSAGAGGGQRRAFMRVSGEDHYSALKRPRWRQRCGRLADWARRKYASRVLLPPDAAPAAPDRAPGGPSSPAGGGGGGGGGGGEYPGLYGVYSETPDMMPLVGSPPAAPGVCYMVGCNAWGQASLSAAAALAPALLGMRNMTPAERRTADLFSLRRFTGAHAGSCGPAAAAGGALVAARSRL